MASVSKNIADAWAYDLDKNASYHGEITDIDVIDQSIELILATTFGERLFNLSFGSSLSTRLFDSLTPTMADNLLNEVAQAIKTWEDRVIVLEDEMRVIKQTDQNTIILVIPYIVKKTKIVSIFKKKVSNF
jgi:hypothetical protein